MNIFELIKRGWHGYTAWCDRMGLTEDCRRCCMPRLSDPPLERNSNAKPDNTTNNFAE
ncbi:hypothetical protein [Shewanella sp.]|uniref:hypothetical protein n=1 Tax=Shewanella sp. TaxID=50422 RepID=UPI003A97AD9F